MSDRERRLGKGLDSLITAARDKSLSIDVVRKSGHRVQSIPVDAIRPNPFQPRRDFPIEELNGLAESLRLHGLLQPIVLRRNESGYELIAGERRWRAARELGWAQIDGVVVEADDRRMVEWALIENIQRQELGALELAEAFSRMVDRFGMTQEEVARRLNVSRPTVANHIRLLSLPESVRERVSRGTVSMGAARAILSLDGVALQEDAARRVESGELSVRQLEALAREPSKESVPARGTTIDPNLDALGTEIQSILGLRVKTRGNVHRGRIIVHFTSAKQLDGLIRRFRENGGGAPDAPDDADSDAIRV